MTVWVCEPQAVRTAVTYSGSSGSETSKIRMPSQLVSGRVVSVEATLPSHSALLRRESVDVTMIPSLTVTSFWEPGQWSAPTSSGSRGRSTSHTCTPS